MLIYLAGGVKIVKKNNSGVSETRNLALKVVTGEWISFIDSDDILPSDALQTLVEGISNDVDLVMAGYACMDEEGKLKGFNRDLISKKLTCQEALVEMFQPKDFSYQGSLWCKLFRTSVIKKNNLQFNSSIFFNEDRLFIVEFLCHSKHFVSYTTKNVYYYILRNKGTMASLQKSYNAKFATDFDAHVIMFDTICALFPDKNLKEMALKAMCDSYKKNHKMMLDFKDYNKDVHRKMLKALRNRNGLKTYILSLLKPFIGYIALLYCPRWFINRF